MLFLQRLELQISELPSSFTVGAVVFETDDLKLALAQESRLWKRAFGAALNHRASSDMGAIFTFVDGLTKRLQRPITDLEDVREAMAALREVSRRLIGRPVSDITVSLTLLTPVRMRLVPFGDFN